MIVFTFYTLILLFFILLILSIFVRFYFVRLFPLLVFRFFAMVRSCRFCRIFRYFMGCLIRTMWRRQALDSVSIVLISFVCRGPQAIKLLFYNELSIVKYLLSFVRLCLICSFILPNFWVKHDIFAVSNCYSYHFFCLPLLNSA